MCGLLGLLTAQQDAAQRVADVTAALRCQRHRGPDETGTWHDADVVLGFNRLSIIDLEHSHQPLQWGPPEAPERYTILFNGEIYNYVELREELRREPCAVNFVTEGDTEVVVAAYHQFGPAAVQRLRGMFAFVIWDSQLRVAFGARDPFGIKPMFSCAGPGGIAFASEKKSLLEIAPSLGVSGTSMEVDRRALQHYLSLQYVPEPASLHTGITRIESGTSFTLSPGGKLIPKRYFQPDFRPRPVRSEAEACALHDEITTAMRDSVAKHLRADVTVGAFLSGGIDSTAIAALAREHVKVVLSGEGADELFGGYTIYREPLSLAAFEKVPGAFRRTLGRIATRIPEGVRGKDLLRRGSLTLEQRYYGNARIFRDDQLRDVLRGYDPTISHTDVTAAAYAASTGWDPVTRMQHVDLFTWLRGDILVKADKMTMANSLELRVPFLDPEVFRVACTIPLEEKITRETTKHALRRALRDIVPAHVLNRRKLGFPVPIRPWLRAELHDWARGIVDDSGTAEFLDRGAVHRMLDEHRAGSRDHSRRIWAVLVFMLWHGIFVEQRIVPKVPEPHYPVQV